MKELIVCYSPVGERIAVIEENTTRVAVLKGAHSINNYGLSERELADMGEIFLFKAAEVFKALAVLRNEEGSEEFIYN